MNILHHIPLVAVVVSNKQQLIVDPEMAKIDMQLQ
jgi:hypothetical protein